MSKAYGDSEILDAIQLYMFGSENPDLIGYRTQSLERDLAHKHIFMWSMRHLCEIGDVYNKRVLDVGCGFGWQALAVSMIGNNAVTANDILPSMIDGTRDCVRSLAAHKKYHFEINPLLGDICTLDLPDGSFDTIYSLESIEHVRDIDEMFTNCARLLAPGGTMILWNDCNLYHKQTRDELTSTFNNRENSWEWCDYLKSIRPIEHANAKPFSVVRSELIRSANPTLDETSVNAVVWATAGMLKLEIERIARTYQLGDRLPERPRIDWCRDPLTGEYAERLFDPFDLVEKLKRLKLKTRVRHAFRRFPLHLLNAVSVRGINKLLFSMKPAFIVIAEKPATI